MDLEEIISEENSAIEKTKVLEELLQKKNESFLKLKKKIIATSSILNIYNGMKNECDNLKNINLNLNNKNDQLTTDYKEFLLRKLDYDKNINHLKSQYDDISKKYHLLVEQDNGKAATIKQLQYLVSELKNKMDGKEIELEMTKSKCKDDIEKYKSKLKSFKGSADVPELKILQNKLLRIFGYIKALRKELDKISMPETKNLKSIFRELNRLKGFKNISVPNLSIEILEEFNEDEMPFNSPASADTGKGSSIYASDDEKSVSAVTTPNMDECLSVTSMYSLSSLLSPSNNYSPCVSVATSPIPNESYLMSTCNRVNKATSPIQFSSPKIHNESKEQIMRGSCETESTNCSLQSFHVEKQDEEYINYILEKMTRPVRIISPLHMDCSESVKPDQSVPANGNPQGLPEVRLKKSVTNRRKLTSRYLSTMVKQLVQMEMKKLSKTRIRHHRFANIIKKRKCEMTTNKLHSNSIRIKKLSLKKIERKIKSKSKFRPINKESSVEFLMKNKLKSTMKIRPNDGKTSSAINKNNELKLIPLCLKEEVLSQRKINESFDTNIKSQMEIENDKMIDKAKKILSQCRLQNEMKDKTSIKWRVGSEIKNKTLEIKENDKVILPNGSLTKQIQPPQICNEMSKSVATIRRSKRKKSSLSQSEENVCNLSNEIVNNTITNDFMNMDDSDINIYDVSANEDKPQNIESTKMTDPVEEILPDSTYFKSLLSASIQDMKRKHPIQNTANEEYCKKFETFLSSEFTAEDLDIFIADNNEESEEKMAYAIVEFLSSPGRYQDVTLQHYPLLPMTQSHQAVLVLINKMTSSPKPKANLSELVMKAIEYKMFKLNKTPPLPSLQNLTPFYVAMCRLHKQKDRLKLFCLDALYCLSFSAIPIVYLVLQCWPAIFPISSKLSSKDSLFVTMVHFLLSNFSERVEYKSKELQKLLQNKYGFKIGQHTDDQILEILVNSIKEGKKRQHKNIIAAFLLLGKKTGVEWCHKNIVTRSLIPVIDDPQSSSFTKAMAIRIIGPLSRPFSHKVLECGVLHEKLVKLFETTGDPQIDVAILSSVFYFNTMNNHFVKILMQWKPNYSLTHEMKHLLEKIIHGKPKGFWVSVLRKDTD